MLKSGRVPSLILWGPPGSGKTTIARLLAGETNLAFEQLSAIFSGVAELRKAFDRAKIEQSVALACRKRPVDPERVERVVNGIVRRLESSGESEIPSTQIGELVMDALRALDPVAYVRFASVYRNFREAKDFEEFISDLAETNLKD